MVKFSSDWNNTCSSISFDDHHLFIQTWNNLAFCNQSCPNSIEEESSTTLLFINVNLQYMVMVTIVTPSEVTTHKIGRMDGLL